MDVEVDLTMRQALHLASGFADVQEPCQGQKACLDVLECDGRLTTMGGSQPRVLEWEAHNQARRGVAEKLCQGPLGCMPLCRTL